MAFLSIPTGTMTHPGTIINPAANTGSAANETAKIALYETMFNGEILAAMRKVRVTEGRIVRRTVPPGMESTMFRQVGKGAVRRHMSGQNLLLDSDVAGNPLSKQVNVGRLKIFLDRPTVAATPLDKWENERNVHDMRGPLAEQLGMDLADNNDGEILRLIGKAATGALVNTTEFIAEIPTSGTVVTDAAMGTNPSALFNAIKAVKAAMDTANMRMGTRHLALGPDHYNLLVENQDLLNKDFGNNNGVYSEGTVYKCWGFQLHMTTAVPDIAAAVGDSTNAFYINGVHGETYNFNGGGGTTIFLAWIDTAVASAVADAINISTDWIPEMRGWLIQAEMAAGHGIIYPKGCAIGRTAAP